MSKAAAGRSTSIAVWQRTTPGSLPKSLPRSAAERLDPVHRKRQRLVVEEERSSVWDLVRRPVEVAGAAGRVQCVADRDLVAYDQGGAGPAREQLPVGLRIA